MLDKKAVGILAKSYASYAAERRRLFAASDDLLAKAKQAIFALHRDDITIAERLIAEAEQGLKSFAPVFKKHPHLAYEGPYRAALEEYVEAKQFVSWIKKENLGSIKAFEIDADSMIGGLSDTVGEMSRKAVQWATVRNYKGVHYAQESAREVVAMLLGMNLTGYQRTKLDQAKQGLRRIEDVAYDVSMHQGIHKADLEKDAFGD